MQKLLSAIVLPCQQYNLMYSISRHPSYYRAYKYSDIKRDVCAPGAGQPLELFMDSIFYREQVQFLFFLNKNLNLHSELDKICGAPRYIAQVFWAYLIQH